MSIVSDTVSPPTHHQRCLNHKHLVVVNWRAAVFRQKQTQEMRRDVVHLDDKERFNNRIFSTDELRRAQVEISLTACYSYREGTIDL